MDAIRAGWSWPACRSWTWSPIRTIRGVGTSRRSGRALSATASTGRSWSIGATMEVLAGNHTLAAARELGWERSGGRRSWMSMTSRRSGSCWSTTAPMTSPATTAAGSPSCSRSSPISTGRATTQAALDALLDELGRPMPSPTRTSCPPLPAKPTHAGRATVYRAGPPPAGLRRRPRRRCLRAAARRRAGRSAVDRPALRRRLRRQDRARLRIAERRSRPASRRCWRRVRAGGRGAGAGAPLYVAHPAGALSLAFRRGVSGARAGGCTRRSSGSRTRWCSGTPTTTTATSRSCTATSRAAGAAAAARDGLVWRQHPDLGARGRPRPRASREHPTMKPPELIEIALRNSSRRGDLVLDPFAGSGSTLVAVRAARPQPPG